MTDLSNPARPATFGSFLVGGRKEPHGDSYVVVDQRYVQWHQPGNVAEHRPILFVHGGGLTGSAWETTPDGRPGWAPRALGAGWPVAITDTVDGGRSGRAPAGVRDEEEEWKTASELWFRYRFGEPGDFGQRRPYPRLDFPVEAFDALLAAHVPRRRTTDDVERTSLAAAVERLAPCHVVAHSHGAHVVMPLLAEAQGKVRSAVLVEPAPFDLRGPGRACPTLVVYSSSAAEHPFWRDLVNAYTSSGLELLDLSDQGVAMSHLPMSGLRSDDVLARVLTWIQEVAVAD